MRQLYTPTPTINYGLPVNWTAPLNRGLVAWWLTLPQLAGRGVWMDLTGMNLGTLTSMVASDWRGHLARPGGWGCLNFDTGDANSNQRVVTAANNLMTSSPYTIAMWVNVPSLAVGVSGIYFVVGNAGGSPVLKIRSAAGSPYFKADFSTTDMISVGNTTLTEGRWEHLITTWTGGVDANVDCAFYINGVDAGHDTPYEIDGVGTEVTKASTVKVIGNGNFSTQEAKAYIDDVRVYDRVLMPVEAAELYHASAGGYVRELNRLRRFTLNEVAAGVTAKPFFYNRYVVARSR